MKLLPNRTSLSQVGVPDELAPLELVLPPADDRYWNCGEVPLRPMKTFAELGANESRIITPALAVPAGLSSFATRAMIVPLPLHG
jgi:hypothetical protein